MVEHDLNGLKRVEPSAEERPVPRWFDRASQKNDEIPEVVVTDGDGDALLEQALKGELVVQPKAGKEEKKAKRGRPAKSGSPAASSEPVSGAKTGSESPTVRSDVREESAAQPLPRSAGVDSASRQDSGKVQPKESCSYLITINTSFGVMEVEAYDVIVEAERKLFGICYLKRIRGNRFLPKPDVGNVEIQVQKADGTETKDYTVVPLGVQFTLPKDGLLVVLFELVQ